MIEKTWSIAEKLILNILTKTQQLHEQLAKEADILKAGQPPELIDQSTTQKKQLANELEALHAQLNQLLAHRKTPQQSGRRSTLFAAGGNGRLTNHGNFGSLAANTATLRGVQNLERTKWRQY